MSTVLTVVVAMPMAALFARFEFRGRRVLWSLLLVPFVLPTVVVGAAFLALLGPKGATGVDLHGTIGLVLIAHVFFNVAVVVRTVGGLWGNLDPSLEPTPPARWGPRRPRAFREVTLPLLRPAIAAASSIVFLFCFTSFGVVLLLGGPRARTLEVEIYDQTARLLHLDIAAVLAIVQLVGVGIALVLYARYQQRRSVQQVLRPRREVAHAPRTAGERLFVAGVLTGMAVLLGAPLAVLVWRSFATGGSATLRYWRALGSSPRGEHPVRLALVGGGQLADRGGGGHRGGGDGRRPGGVGAGPARARVAVATGGHGPRLVRRRAHVAAGHLGGDRRLRLPHRPRQAPARPARLVVARAPGPGHRGRAVRDPHAGAGAALDRRRAA